MAATPDQEQRIKVETTRVLLDNDGQGVTPNSMKTITVARKISEKEISELEGLGGLTINDVIRGFGRPFKVNRRVTPFKIEIGSVLAAHDEVTEVHRSMAISTTKSHAERVQDAASIASKAVEILEQALDTVKEMFEKAVEAAAEAAADAEKAKKAGKS